MFVVYKHTNKINGKSYVGITSRNPDVRWGTHGSNYSGCKYFYSAIKKYGWENFEHTIIVDGLTKEDACKKEIELIAELKTNDNKYGYNCTSGGDVFVMNEKAKKNLSIAMRGNKNGLGHPCSKEKAEKISNAQKGRIFSDEQRKKMSLAASKRHIPCSVEKKMALSASYPHKRKVYCKELDRVFCSVQACGKELDIYPTNISKVCRGIGKTLKGMHFQYCN